MSKDSQLNVFNVQQMRAQPPGEFQFLRVDANNDCNVHCVYCHNPRTKDVIATGTLRSFFDENVVAVENLQLGCIMEPTLDERMADLLLMANDTRAKPRSMYMLQTNGILLHRHDVGKIREARLTDLSVSIDSADPAVHKAQRGGTSMAKVQRNVERFHEECPDVAITFITTVTRLNVAGIGDLVEFGLGLGVGKFVLREVFYHPESDVVNHDRMPSLVLEAGAFHRMRDEIMAEYGDRASFLFADSPTLDRGTQKVIADSLLRR